MLTGSTLCTYQSGYNLHNIGIETGTVAKGLSNFHLKIVGYYCNRCQTRFSSHIRKNVAQCAVTCENLNIFKHRNADVLFMNENFIFFL